MSSSGKLDAATGVLTIAVAGFTGSFTAAEAREWGEVLIYLFPYILIVFLLYRVRQLAKQHQDCIENHDKLQQQIITSFRIVRSVAGDGNVPSEEDFLLGHVRRREDV